MTTFKKAAAGVRGKLITVQTAKSGKSIIERTKVPKLKDTPQKKKGPTKGIEAITGSETERRTIAWNKTLKG